jgi:hypothetical protein
VVELVRIVIGVCMSSLLWKCAFSSLRASGGCGWERVTAPVSGVIIHIREERGSSSSVIIDVSVPLLVSGSVRMGFGFMVCLIGARRVRNKEAHSPVLVRRGTLVAGPSAPAQITRFP